MTVLPLPTRSAPVTPREPGSAPRVAKTRVVFVLRSLPAYRLPLLRRLVATCPDFDLTVITGSESVAERGKLKTETSVQPFTVVPVKGRVWEFWKYTVVWLHDCIHHLKAQGADVVVVEGNFGILSQAVVAGWARLTGRRVVYWVAGWQKPWVTGLAAALRNSVMRLVLPLGHHSVCYSTASSTMLRGLGVAADRVSVAQNTIDTEAIAAAEPASRQAATRLRRELGIGDQPVLVYVGALGHGKGAERLIELHSELRRRGLEVHTVIVGDGPARADLVTRSAGIDGIHLLGRIVSGVDPYFALGDLFVLPGLGGLAINQAMANRLPVLCTRADGTERDLVADGVTGYFRDHYELAEWADLAEGLIRDPRRRQAMADAAQARVLAVAGLTGTSRAFEAAIRNRPLAAPPSVPALPPRKPSTTGVPVSVLMSTYAGEQAAHLEAALRSCADQVKTPQQIVLVVDGPVPPDQTTVIADFADVAAGRDIEFTVVHLAESGGLARAMNQGLPHCRHDYVARMDSDDQSAPERFAAQWQVLSDRPETDLVATWQADFESDPEQVFRIKPVPELHGDIVEVLRWRNVVSHPSILVKKSLVTRLGGYREIRYLEDYDLFMRLLDAGATFYGIQRPLILVRVTDAQRFRRGGWRYAWDELRFRVGLYRRGSISLANLCLTGPTYFAFRLAPAWAKRSLYAFVRRSGRSKSGTEEAPRGSDTIGTVGRVVAEGAAGAFWRARRPAPNTGATVPVLCYHRIVPEPFEDRIPSSCVAPDQFAEHLRFLKREGFATLSLAQYDELVRGRAAIPDRAVLITFDDGYHDFAKIAQPIAEAEGAAINLFLCTGLPAGINPTIYDRQSRALVDHQARYPALWKGLTWDEIRALDRRGVGLGFHSHRHPNYGRLSPAGIAADIDLGLAAWREQLGWLPTSFAFPKGGYGACPDVAVRLLGEAGLSLLFSTHLGRTALPSEAPLLDRIVMHKDDRIEVFERKLLGAYDWLGGIRTLAQAGRAVLRR